MHMPIFRQDYNKVSIFVFFLYVCNMVNDDEVQEKNHTTAATIARMLGQDQGEERMRGDLANWCTERTQVGEQ